mgnify:CR=1 FL=1
MIVKGGKNLKVLFPAFNTSTPFSKALFTKVLVEEEMGGTTYSVQYYAYSKSTLTQYYKEYANQLQADGMKRFGNKMLAFRTELELVDEFKVTKD